MAASCPAARPCPRAECRYHLRGAESCALDVANRGPSTVAEIARAMGQTPQSVADAVTRGLARLAHSRLRLWV